MQEEYTVEEGEGSVRVCAALNSTNTITLRVKISTVEFIPGDSNIDQAKGI